MGPNTAARRRPRQSSPAAESAIALTVAGSDTSAGAGIQADLKTFSALGVYGLTAITCIVAEIPGKVSELEPIDPVMVRKQIQVLFDAFRISAAKTGLLCRSETISAVAGILRTKNVQLVVDPVMIATSGDQLLSPGALDAYERELFPMATLITPNLDEAATLLGGEEIADRSSMAKAARRLGKRYGAPVLLKGGHLHADIALDVLCRDGKITEFSAPFVPGIATHGTGCTYSAAITAGLASGLSLCASIDRAKHFVTRSIRRHLRWKAVSGAPIDTLNQFG
jgi:hydroxymethylpyrimidine/phosphomethylpyrimidine kinase